MGKGGILRTMKADDGDVRSLCEGSEKEEMGGNGGKKDGTGKKGRNKRRE